MEFTQQEVEELKALIRGYTEQEVWNTRDLFNDILSHQPKMLKQIMQALSERSSALLKEKGIKFIEMAI